jgi:peptidoglycan/xylan/chitin deacetylase (PgdA/CDA1 family)
MMPELVQYGYPATLYVDTAQLERGGIVPHVMARYIRQAADLGPALAPEAEAAFAAAIEIARPYGEKCEALERFAAAIGFDFGPYRAARAFEYMRPDELVALASAGFDVQLHTHNHTMGDLSPAAVGAELDANAAALARLLGRAPDSCTHLCYPSGVTDPAIAEWIIVERGIGSATTTVRAVAAPTDFAGLLPRLIDGDNDSEIEFEAEMRGFIDNFRRTFTTH